ncbi:ABC transporter ATP-binding protein [Chitinophaga sp. 22321]|uniref:ABC transporter ATP-binding protein n=1 Tax=Chitinophaga hostae TaxID=2831022 RepID=A0ABS5JC95_9BACT|nr:ABC transporter ATP-binding protein [Chitinophaga hostae]MBS0032097.1 ABC transporter ATP-binding protein [Chitinophaga hostae]
MVNIRIISGFFPFLRPYWKGEIVLILLMLLSNLSMLASPYLLKIIIDVALPQHSYEMLAKILITLVGIYVLRIGSSFLADYYYANISNKVVSDIRLKVFSHLLHMPLSYFTSNKTGDIIQKMDDEVEHIETALTKTIVRIINNGITLGGIITMLCILDTRLFLVSAVIFPLIILNVKYFSPKIKLYFKWISAKQADLQGYFIERFENIRLIRASNTYRFEQENMKKISRELRLLNVKQAIKSSLNNNIAVFMMALGPIIVWSYGGRNVLAGGMTLGSLVAFLQYLNRIYSPSTEILNLYTDLLRATVSMQQIREILETPVENIYEGRKKLPDPITDITTRELSFAYGNTPVLNRVSLHLKQGQIYALVGKSGDGKSTLVNLLCKFIPVTGSIYINNTPLEDIGTYDWMNKVAVVSQGAALLKGKISENISYGNPGATCEDIEAAAGMTGIYQQLKNGGQDLDTATDSLSGGQMQRVAIARALLREAAFIILDEATAALDTASELAIINLLQTQYRNSIILVVTHRLSMARQCDEIICLENGSIAETGTHEALWQGNGAYRQLFFLQDKYEDSQIPFHK